MQQIFPEHLQLQTFAVQVLEYPIQGDTDLCPHEAY